MTRQLTNSLKNGPSDCGRAIAKVVSRWLISLLSRFRSLTKSCGICGGQYDTGADLLRVLRFLLPIISPTVHHYPTFGAATLRQILADVPSGLRFTPP